MKSFLGDDFVALFALLPDRVKRQARKNYRLWREDPRHPSLDFKRVGKTLPVYSVRVGIGWRALGLKERNGVVWFWIGSHAEYDRLLRGL
ncbi:MAG: hypothetical protein SCH98_17530 [Deferrisomatales bacterium]|nr:hypothetical protein [Deferrisomatales bacterium]